MQFRSCFLWLSLVALFLSSCGDDPKAPTDTLNSGHVTISVDETYRPVIEQQKRVFDSSNPDAHVQIEYKSEAECFKDYLSGKTRLILVTRDLSEAEKEFCKSKTIYPESMELARDAVAVIVNNKSVDTSFSLGELYGILTGAYKKKFDVVFDNNGSSTLRFIQDSILHGATLGKNVFAAHGNDSVVNYVQNNPNSIGLVGLSYVSSDDDPNNTGAFINSVKVAYIFNDSTREYLQPYQAYIALRSYPLSRNLYYIKNETYHGLGTGFANFLARDRGQLIFAHAHLFPLQKSVILRDAAITNHPIGH
ncbi:MAG: substrate-binding domain-containing protein [Bacteroidetes bacterium]|nr:substrate-binding domain-containing protein [Bacteroidota bacterium]